MDPSWYIYNNDYPSPVYSNPPTPQQLNPSGGPIRSKRLSPRDPHTDITSPFPSSMPSPNFSPYEHAHRARTRSITTSYLEGRPHSPALSAASGNTSSSSRGYDAASFDQPRNNLVHHNASQKEKHKKHRLRDVDRKNICLYHERNKNARQEDIGMVFGVERSTISKILKEKEKWLNISAEDECDQTTKHRPSKFPEIEEKMTDALFGWAEKKTSITDALIRNQALAIAKAFGIGTDKFKGSSGWIENFKHRHDIRRGEWLKYPQFKADFDAHNTVTVKAHIPSTPHIIPYDQPIASTVPTTYRQPSSQDSDASHELHPSIAPHWSGASQQSHPSIMMDPALSGHVHQQAHQTYYSQPLYGPGIIPPQQPTIEDAEEAINILITFVDTVGKDILKSSEREILAHIKCALFQAANDLPYERPT